jgi:hypothetical protein
MIINGLTLNGHLIELDPSAERLVLAAIPGATCDALEWTSKLLEAACDVLMARKKPK